MGAMRSILLLALLLLGAAMQAQAQAPTEPRQAQLLRLLRQDCGSCHGMRLSGGLGPPLSAEALQRLPLDSLTATIYQGRPGTPMPPWRGLISEAEARWLAERLLAGVPAQDPTHLP